MSNPTAEEKIANIRRRIAEAKQEVDNCELALGNAREVLSFWQKELRNEVC